MNEDEVVGYWVFVLGLLLAAAGFLLFLPSEAAGTIRQYSIMLAAAGLALLLAGPVIRLPLKRPATYTTYLGVALCLAAVAYFFTVFPDQWDLQTGDATTLILYGVGVALIALGGAVIPLLSEAEEAATAVEDLGDAEAARDDERAAREEQERAAAEAREQRDEVAAERDDLADELEAVRAERDDLQSQIESLRASQAQFELYEDRGGEYRWRLRHRNTNIIATGGEGYTRKHNAQKGLQSVRRNALGAAVVHQDHEPEIDDAEDLDEEPFVPEEAEESQAEFELYEDSAGEYRWRLRHRNGNIVADGGEGYTRKAGAQNGIRSVKNNVVAADYLRFDPASFEVYRDAAGEWRWRLVHRNGNILGDSGEGYTRRRDARRAIEAVRERATDEEAVETYEDNAGEYRWRLVANNGEQIADSGEGYASQSNVEDAVERLAEYAPEADALDLGMAGFEVFEDVGGEWRWRLRHRNGNIIADSGEGYTERGDAHEAIERVKRHAPAAEVVEE
jgi:uncharacterized protein YegP (UPF0339 family)